jgi:hypothetical protein
MMTQAAIHSFVAADCSPTIELVFEKLPSRRTGEKWKAQ